MERKVTVAGSSNGFNLGSSQHLGNEVMTSRRSSLQLACQLGDEEKVKGLILGGCDLGQLDFTGCSCVQIAAATGHFNIVKLLVANGAIIENRDASHGNTALHEASWRGYSNLVNFMSNSKTVNIQNKGGFSPLHLACQAGHNQSTRELLLAGANPDLTNTYGDTCLHTAVRYGHAGVARILLSARADTNSRNKNGDIPLHISSAMGRTKLTKILISGGSLVNLRNNQGETPEDISLRKEFSEVHKVFQNPPPILTPIERDQMRVSKYKGSSSVTLADGSSSSVIPGPSQQSHDIQPSKRSSNRSNPSSKTGSKKSKSASSLLKDEGLSTGIIKEEVPKWSPYGCHVQPNTGEFPPPNIDSLPKEPLKTGELYYLDLAGNIHKGPMGYSEGCVCGPVSGQWSPEAAVHELQPMRIEKRESRDKDRGHSCDDLRLDEHCVQESSNYEDQLKSLTYQLSKIHLDTQAQFSSLQSLLNERLAMGRADMSIDDDITGEDGDRNEMRLKQWVREYRQFRKELSKNPKMLHQASDLLASASSLLSTRLASPAPVDSETDSGI